MSRVYHLSKPARERGTYPIKFTVRDSFGLVVNSGNIPSVSWWLTDLSGRIINLRANVEITSLSNPFYVVLSDADLQITERERGENERILTLRGTYNSDLGTGLPFTYSVSFSVINEVVVDIDLYVSAFDAINVEDIS